MPANHMIKQRRKSLEPDKRAIWSTKCNSLPRMFPPNSTPMCIESSSTPMKVLDPTSSQLRPLTLSLIKPLPRKLKHHSHNLPNSTHGLIASLRRDTVTISSRTPKWYTEVFELIVQSNFYVNYKVYQSIKSLNHKYIVFSNL